MAQKVIVALIDDIDGSPAARTITFSIEGTGYEIDLSEGNVKKFLEDLAPYLDVARKTRPSVRRRPRTPAPGRENNAAIRAWANANGYDLSSRGRIPAAVVEAFEKAHA